jgi:hypothetical protein
MKKNSSIVFFLMCFLIINAQPDSIVSHLPRPSNTWESGFQQRVTKMWGTRIGTYSVNPGNGGVDGGKSEWPKLLAKMAWPATNNSSSTMKSFVDIGRNMVNGSNVGSFYSPFSCAGYAMYYFRWKDSIALHDPSQVDLIYKDVKLMWHQLMKADHVFDPCCGYNSSGGKEFNSENFHWMMRAAGYLFAHEIHNKTVNGSIVDMTNLNLSSNGILLHTGLSNPRTKTVYPTNVNAIAYFDGFLKNLTRALFNAGRVEWNSNNYFGHTLNPLLTIYEGADKCNDPNADRNKKRAQACLDWMMTEAALHFVDGSQVAADARAKGSSFLPFKGSYYQFTIPFFTDDINKPSFSSEIWASNDPTEMEVGFMLSSSYRPPQIIIDMAQRNFPLPVEVQSAKPFYHIDQGKYFNNDGTINGEFPYNDWNGTNHGRRFEFETTWVDQNITMASAAVGRPDGSKGTYSEQCMWRIGVKGQKNGVRMLSGNAGSMTSTAGRSPQHEIGQFRNMMMQMVKHNTESNNKIWFFVPDSLHKIKSNGESEFWDVQEYKWIGNKLYLKLRSDVFLAVKPFPEPIAINISTSSEGPDHSVVSFKWAANQLGALVFEVGTTTDYVDFIDFVSTQQTKSISMLNATTYSYTSPNNNTIKMEYVEPGSFSMTPFTFDTPTTNPFTPAGTYPKVWGNEQFIDYQSWDSYRTVFGHDLLNQVWGSGVMTIKAGGKSARITVEPTTADVTFQVEKKNTLAAIDTDFNTTKKVYPNPFDKYIFVENEEKNVQYQLFDLQGVKIDTLVDNNVITPLNCKSGIYILKLTSNKGSEIFKVLKK